LMKKLTIVLNVQLLFCNRDIECRKLEEGLSEKMT
jgi:hypothetical protein